MASRKPSKHIGLMEVNFSLMEETRGCSSEYPLHAWAPLHVPAGRCALPATLPPPWRICPWAHPGCPGSSRPHLALGPAAGTEKAGSTPVLTLQEMVQAAQWGGGSPGTWHCQLLPPCLPPRHSVPPHLRQLLPCPRLRPRVAHQSSCLGQSEASAQGASAE